ncbi:MAG: winged helix DNA-binding protein [Acetobacteraceae bacterium]|nr:winged helix DNA-binding protein [Acetobacteraceae bacterium]
MASSPDPVVSSAHLAAGGSPHLSELEFGLILSGAAFQRWMVACMTAAGQPGLSWLEVLVLHTVRHRDRPKRLAEVMRVLAIEEPHVARYAVRKLAQAGLVELGRAGKEQTVAVTDAGRAACARYHEIREALLIRAVGEAPARLSEAAALLRALSGAYDQAARAAATM